jgi:hypothetical protein
MAHQRLSLDHVAFGALDVGALQRDLARLGFTTTAIGICRWTAGDQPQHARALSVVFEHGYLDFVENGSSQWTAFVQRSAVYGRGAAPSGVVLGAPSAADAYAQLSARGVPLRAPYSIVRELSGADPSRISYRIFAIDRRHMQLPFAIIEDSAPAAMRTPPWTAHRNSVRSIGVLHLHTPDLDRTVAELAAILPDAAIPDAAGSSYRIGSAILTLHEAPDDEFLGEVSAAVPAYAGPSLLALEFDATDLSAAQTCLRSSSVRFTVHRESLAVDPTEGFGCGILIRQSEK